MFDPNVVLNWYKTKAKILPLNYKVNICSDFWMTINIILLKFSEKDPRSK